MTDGSNAWQFRRATPGDGEGLYQLYAKMGRKEAGYFETCLAEQDSGRRAIVILSRGGADIGYGMLNRRPQYPLYRHLGVPEIQDLNVIPEARRQGAATALITYFEDMVRAEGGKQVGISVGLHADYGPAQRLYAKLGYIPDGYGVSYDRVTVKGGEIRPVDDNLCLMMIKELAAGS